VDDGPLTAPALEQLLERRHRRRITPRR
jgi:hypothetical protein